MNYYLLRFVILLFILVLFLVFFYKKIVMLKKKDIKLFKNSFKYLTILCFLLFFILSIIPFEFFLKFKSPQTIMKYYKPTSIIVKIIEREDYCYVIFYDKIMNTYDIKSFIKKNDYWRVENYLKKGKSYIFIYKDNANMIKINKINLKKSAAIMIELRQNKNKIEVSDSLNSKFFEFYRTERNLLNTATSKKVAVIDLNDNNYELIINDKSYYPFKK